VARQGLEVLIREVWVERGRLLHDAILSLEQFNRVIVHVPANPVKIVEAKIETKGGKGSRAFRIPVSLLKGSNR